jgi:uncharacterized protein GlcG (DUF336 family)
MDLLTLAKNVAERAEAESITRKAPISVCIIDIHGNVVLQHRMTGAPAFSLELSERKAYTSALVRRRTADLVPLVQPGQPLFPLIMISGGRYSAMDRRMVHAVAEDSTYRDRALSGRATVARHR